MDIVGYADPWSVAPGETVRFMVSSQHARYNVDFVRLRHGDPNPAGPGFIEEGVASVPRAEYPGRVQKLAHGSYVLVGDAPDLQCPAGVTLQAWILPTLLDGRQQTIVAKWSARESAGYVLVMDEHGELALLLGPAEATKLCVRSGAPLRTGSWHFVAASYDPARGRVALVQRPYPVWPSDASSTALDTTVARAAITRTAAPLVIAGCWDDAGDGPPGVRDHFNGKIEAPSVFSTALPIQAIEALWRGSPPTSLGQPVAAAWNFARETSTAIILDVSGHELHGRVVNMPTRGMTGHAFNGRELDWRHSNDQHTAIHFHADDLEDAGWDVDFTFTVPAQLRSGIYAARLTAESAEDHIPFFVRPAERKASAPILLLLPTNSYLAYANFHMSLASEQRLLGLYHRHADGSGVCYSSSLRPIANLRPRAYFNVLGEHGAPHQLGADLYITDWLEARGFSFDVATDADLHAEGIELLSQYRSVLSGTHPEYWTESMLDGLDGYLEKGGRFMYLGGNGLYWVTSFDPHRPTVVEVRRTGGTRTWVAGPGEEHHSTTGEPGGLWRNRGRAPQQRVGVGFTAQGFDRSAPFYRERGSFDPRAAWIFEGVGADEPIGDFGLVMGGAAGFELDHTTDSLGTPPHALVLASATAFPSYERSLEEQTRVPGTTVRPEPPIRAEMVYFETPNGGAVFSVSSIAYCGSLSHNQYNNNVSRITENVLRRFVADKKE